MNARTDRRTWSRLATPPVGPQFEALLDFALARKAHHPAFLLVERPGGTLSAAGRELLSALEPWRVTTLESDRWPGTQLQGQVARVSFFHLERGAVTQLKHVDGLAAFAGPDLPEDLCIVAADKSPWLASTAQSGRFLLHLTDEERRDISKALPWMVLTDEPAP